MIRTLTEGNMDALFSLRRVGFFQQIDPDNEAFTAQQRARLSITRGYFAEGELASAATMYPFKMFLSGKVVKMGGLAGVMSAPEYRRRGHVRALLEDGFERLHEQGVGWSLEHPFDPRYYARYGYQSVSNGRMVELPCSRLFQGTPPEAERLELDDLAQLKETHAAWAAQHNFALTRNDNAREAWRRLVKSPWEDKERITYKLQDAYCILMFSYGESGKPNLLNVHDYAYSSPQGRDNLLRFWGNFEGQAEVVRLHLPSDDPLLFDSAEFVKRQSVVQARVVDFSVALTQLSSPQEAHFTLKVEDDFCPWNNATFEVKMNKEQVEVEPTNKSADLTLDVRTLPLLLSGTIEANAAERLGLIEGEVGAARALASLSGNRVPFLIKADFF